jgi:hypothetical protein
VFVVLSESKKTAKGLNEYIMFVSFTRNLERGRQWETYTTSKIAQ